MKRVFRFVVGLRFSLRGHNCELVDKLSDGRFIVLDNATGIRRKIPLEALQVAYANDELLPLPEPGGPPDHLTPPSGSLDTEPPEIREAAYLRHAYYVAMDEAMAEGMTKEAAAKKARVDVSRERNDPKPPSATTLGRGHKLHREADGHVNASIPRRSRGNRTQRVSEEQLRIIEQAVSETGLTPERQGYAAAHRKAEEITKELNEKRRKEGLPPIKAPGKDAVKGVAKKLERTKRGVAARYGNKKAKESFKVYGKSEEPTRVMERVVIDHKHLDIIVVDDVTGLELGRPWLTTAIDYTSRSIVGFALRLHAPDSVSLMACLRVAIFPTTWLRDRYPDVKGKWLPYGQPEVLYNDNGPDLKASPTWALLEAQHIHQKFGAKEEPWYRGVIEVIHKTIKTEVIDPLPGKTFSNPQERGDYDSVGNAKIGFEKLGVLLTTWIVDIYQRRTHSTLNCSPNEAWQRAAELYPPGLACTKADLAMALPGNINYTNDKNGIRILGIGYDSPELLRVRELHGKLKLMVKRDPFDASFIYVRDPDTHEYFKAYSRIPEYTTGLTWDQHDIIRKRVPRDSANPDELIEARIGLARKVQEEIEKRLQGPGRPDLAFGALTSKLADIIVPYTAIESDGYEPAPSETILSPLGESLNDADDLYGISEVAAESPDAADQDDDATEMDPAEHDVLEAADD